MNSCTMNCRRLLLATLLLAAVSLSGCVATTVVGAAVGATVAVGTAVVEVPIKATKAVIDVAK